MSLQTPTTIRTGQRKLIPQGEEEQKGDEGDGDLNAHGVFRRAEEVLDLEGLLDPAEEHSNPSRGPVHRAERHAHGFGDG